MLHIIHYHRSNSDNSENLKSMMVTEVKGHTEINPCVIANTSQMSFKANRSQVNLLLEMTSENCTEAIDEGSLYLRGVCMASNKFGSTSETFVLGVFTTNYITTVSHSPVGEVFLVKNCTTHKIYIF